MYMQNLLGNDVTKDNYNSVKGEKLLNEINNSIYEMYHPVEPFTNN